MGRYTRSPEQFTSRSYNSLLDSIKPSTMAEELDMENRDVNNLNSNISAIEFHDVLGEPDATHSIDCVWKNSFKCFNCTLSCCYKVLTLFCGIPLAFCWACEFACLSCSHIWYYTPALKICDIEMMVTKKFIDACLLAFVAPCCETCGLLFSRIAVANK